MRVSKQWQRLALVAGMAALVALPLGSREAKGGTERKEAESKTPAASSEQHPPLYLCFIIHNEEDTDGTNPTDRADLDGDEATLKFTTKSYRRIGEIFRKHNAKVNLQPDWTFVDGVVKFDPNFFKDWEAMGHETDPHAHETHVSYEQVHQKLLDAGAHASGILGGCLESVVQERLRAWEAIYPKFYALWGVAMSGHVEKEESTGYVWRPSKTGSWFQHDPQGKMIYIGGNVMPMDVPTILEYYDKAKPHRVNVCTMFLGTFESPDMPQFGTPEEIEAFDSFLTELDETKREKNIQYSSFAQVVEIFKRRETAGELDFSDVDVNNIPRRPMGRLSLEQAAGGKAAPLKAPSAKGPAVKNAVPPTKK